MPYIWWGLFLVSASALALLLLRNRYAVSWLVTVGLHLVAAAVLLYAVNWGGSYFDFHIPVNVSTIAAIGILGIPGLMLLVALKVSFIG